MRPHSKSNDSPIVRIGAAPALFSSTSPISQPLSPPLPSNSTNVPLTTASPLLAQRRLSRQSSDPNVLTVVYSIEGPLGLQFDDVDAPFKVGGVKPNSLSDENGVKPGDSLLSVNGKSVEGLAWEDLKVELQVRPAIALFRRPVAEAQPTESAPSVWNLAAGLVRGDTESKQSVELKRERDELRAIIESMGGSEIDRLREIADEYDRIKSRLLETDQRLSQMTEARNALKTSLSEEKEKNSKLVDVIDEIEKSQAAIIDRFEREISSRDKQISELRQIADSATDSVAAEALKEALADSEYRVQLMEKDHTRLRKENTELGIMVQQCLEKIQRDLSDKPHWVDRRIVCSAIATFLRETDGVDDVDIVVSSRQRLGDVLGLTHEERISMGLLTVRDSNRKSNSFGHDFVSFLEREAGNEKVEFIAENI
jgi:hypothetical protein